MKRSGFIIIAILLLSAFLRFYNLMHDEPYFFDPDERNMASAITQFRLPAKLSEIPSCIQTEFFKDSVQKSAGSQLPSCNLNPHFFAYGQFPLYLAFVSDQVSKTLPLPSQHIADVKTQLLTTNYPSAIFWLRFWSAVASVLTIYLVFLISKKLFSTKIAEISALTAGFLPGLIQSAHFGTTESLLTFFFLCSTYLSLQFLSLRFKPPFKKYLIRNTKYLILFSLSIGLALGSKFTGLFFLFPPFVTIILMSKLVFIKKRKNWPFFLLGYWVIGLLIVTGSLICFVLSSPYNLVEPKDFRSAVFGYEADVAMGKYEAFYTRQFVQTTPVVFQSEKVFPYVLGWPVFILGVIGFIAMMVKLIKQPLSGVVGRIKNYELRIKTSKNTKFNIPDPKFLILISSFLVFFFPNAFLFAKWTRFMTPILPFFVLFAGYVISKIQKRVLNVKYSLFFVICNLLFLIPGIAFMSVYARDDSRMQASKTIFNLIPSGSYVLSETANVIDIPFGIENPRLPPLGYTLTTISFDFYHVDDNPVLFTDLINHLTRADYILIPSRRIFANYARIPNRYPLTNRYYQLLFNGRLGFEKISEVSSFPSLCVGSDACLSFPDETSEETFTVFDHPVIRIYKKTKPFTSDEYRQLFETPVTLRSEILNLNNVYRSKLKSVRSSDRIGA